MRLLRILPPALRQRAAPYAQLMRADKPIGTALLYLPCSWSILMAASHPATAAAATVSPLATAKMLALFASGAYVMRGAGCTINDLWDRDFDRRVERTRSRPLASGAVSPRQALVFLAAQLSVGAGLLAQLNTPSIVLGASSLVLVAVYPLMKRITYYPQFVLGLTFNWGALLGFSAMSGGVLPPAAYPLYAAGVAWTLVYDTLYAHQDKRDDLVVGVKSTALALGDSGTKPVLSALAVATATGLGVAGWANGQAWVYYVGVAAAGVQLVRIVRETDLDRPDSCWRAFVRCGWAGAAVTGGLALDYALQLWDKEQIPLPEPTAAAAAADKKDTADSVER
ncbi:Para-hydroxybenzoate--polyprenyltransferase, mitochondrial precursor (PHB:polyprenyltransferase) [Sorochytrium milnesiophthora]